MNDNYKILIVEDELDLLTTILDLAEDFNFEEDVTLTGRSDGLSAWEAFYEENFDIILTDVNMPGMTGVELIKKIRELDPFCEFMVMSGYMDLPMILEISQWQPRRLLAKPIEIPSILKELKSFVELKKLERIARQHLEGLPDKNTMARLLAKRLKDAERVLRER